MHKDTSKKRDGEFIIKAFDIISGLNRLGMKSKECHKPSLIFSAK